MIRIMAFTAALALGACATAPILAGPMRIDSHAALNQPTQIGALVVTPRQVIEDSRCPASVQCISAGRVVLRTQIDGAGWTETRDLKLAEPQAVHEHRITLTSVEPQRQTPDALGPEAYEFGFEGGTGR
jgi:hypothetical protein